MGHSHTEFAYNDSLIKNVKNFANSAEPYFYTYSKLKILLRHNSELKNVILEFSNNSISISMDDWIWADKYLDHRFTFYSPFLEKDQINTILYKNPISTIENYLKSIISNFWKIFRNDIDYTKYFGQYSELERIMQESEKVSYDIQESSPVSEENLRYLDRIIELCKINNINLFFIRTPQHEYCSELANEPTFQKVYKERYNEILFFDLQKLPLTINDYADVEHLNKYGAKKVSLFLNEILQEGILTTENPEKFLEEKIAEKINNLD
jgi:hypothetical protein